MSTLFQQLNEEISALITKVARSVVKVGNNHNGAGAGTVLHADGLILTNAHVVHHGFIEVTLPDQRKLPARMLAYDPELDLAALSVDAHDLATLELGDSRALQPGQLVFALGHPWGVPNAVTAGSVINVGLPPEISQGAREFVQAGLHLRPGHSGGPMVDAQGRLVGINTMITGPEVGLAVPVHVVKSFLRHHLGLKPKSEETYI
ncbi:MAG TPA: trypsin-like peptidase domain-containing protein [Anaerolineae bacterium]|nr:trypsin-like peptidase domain-containing protein [Anaerolineae bacterium]